MDKPKLSEYFLPILKSFTVKPQLTRSEIVDFIAQNFDIIQKDSPKRSLLLINACIGYFLKSKVIIKIDNQLFRISDRGTNLLKKNIEIINVKFLRKFPEFDEFIRQRYSNKQKVAEDIIVNDIPEDKIITIYEVYKRNLAIELLENIKKSSWQFFEILVKDLLVAMGYGDPHDEARITKGSSDNGIDGIVKADVLGLELICIQAKKWEDNVGRPEIQKFAGSIESHKAKKGIFFTTSYFTNEAKQYVNSIEKKIILIDGLKLTELMIDYNIGVGIYKEIILKKIDTNYFDFS